MRFFIEGYFLSNFWKVFPRPPFTLFFRKCGFGLPGENCHNLAIQTLLEPPYAPKSSPVFARWEHANWRIMPFVPECFLRFKEARILGRFLKHFLWSPLCTFSENAGFGWPWDNLNDLAIRAFWSRCLRQNLLQSLHFKCILIGG